MQYASDQTKQLASSLGWAVEAIAKFLAIVPQTEDGVIGFKLWRNGRIIGLDIWDSHIGRAPRLSQTLYGENEVEVAKALNYLGSQHGFKVILGYTSLGCVALNQTYVFLFVPPKANEN
jgi:hypothetical protein